MPDRTVSMFFRWREQNLESLHLSFTIHRTHTKILDNVNKQNMWPITKRKIGQYRPQDDADVGISRNGFESSYYKCVQGLHRNDSHIE